jgi:hypothetical protein
MIVEPERVDSYIQMVLMEVGPQGEDDYENPEIVADLAGDFIYWETRGDEKERRKSIEALKELNNPVYKKVVKILLRGL